MKRNLTLFFTVCLLAVVLILPRTSLAVLQQPPGEFPITEPLHPAEPGIQPNYSKNVQDGQPVNSENGVSQNDSSSVETDPIQPHEVDSATGQPIVSNNLASAPEPKSNWKFWVAGLILVIVVLGSAWFWRQKKLSKASTVLVIVAVVFTGIFSGAIIKLAFAQNQDLPANQNTNKEIQRTIIVEGEDSDSPVVEPEKSRNTPLFGATAVVLLLIAGGAVYLFWTRSPAQPKL